MSRNLRGKAFSFLVLSMAFANLRILGDATADKEASQETASALKKAVSDYQTEVLALADKCAKSSAFECADAILKAASQCVTEAASMKAAEISSLAATQLQGKDAAALQKLRESSAFARTCETLNKSFDALGQKHIAKLLVVAKDGNSPTADKEAAIHMAMAINPNDKDLRAHLKQSWCGMYGWMDEPDVKKYKLGLRRVGAEWFSKDALNKLNSERSKWTTSWEVASRHFIIKSTAAFSDIEALLENLEHFHTVALKLFNDNGMEIVDRGCHVIYYFHNKDDYLAHKCKGSQRTGENVQMFFSTGCDHSELRMDVYKDNLVTHIFKERDRPSPEQDAFYHELTHHLLLGKSLSNTEVHHWIQEGIATYFEYPVESQIMRDSTMRTSISGSNKLTWAKSLVQAGDFKPLDAFMKLSQDAFNALPPGEQNNKNYPLSMALTHFFIHAKNGKYRKPFFRLLKLHTEGKGFYDEFEKNFGATPESFTEEWVSYMKGLK